MLSVILLCERYINCQVNSILVIAFITLFQQTLARYFNLLNKCIKSGCEPSVFGTLVTKCFYESLLRSVPVRASNTDELYGLLVAAFDQCTTSVVVHQYSTNYDC